MFSGIQDCHSQKPKVSCLVCSSTAANKAFLSTFGRCYYRAPTMTRSKQQGSTTWATLPPLQVQQNHSCKRCRSKRAARLVKNHDLSADDVTVHLEVKEEEERAISDAHHARASDKKAGNESKVTLLPAAVQNPQVGDSPQALANGGPLQLL